MFLDVASGLVTWLFKLRAVPWWLWAAALALSASPLAVVAAWFVWGTNQSERVAAQTKPEPPEILVCALTRIVLERDRACRALHGPGHSLLHRQMG